MDKNLKTSARLLALTKEIFKGKLQDLAKVTINPFVPNAPFLYPLKTSENFLLKLSSFRVP